MMDMTEGPWVHFRLCNTSGTNRASLRRPKTRSRKLLTRFPLHRRVAPNRVVLNNTLIVLKYLKQRTLKSMNK